MAKRPLEDAEEQPARPSVTPQSLLEHAEDVLKDRLREIDRTIGLERQQLGSELADKRHALEDQAREELALVILL